jgi:glucose/arabinose dehydrogenase
MHVRRTLLALTASAALAAYTLAAASAHTAAPQADPPTPTVTDVLADGIGVPWGMDFLPDGSALVTDRDSALIRQVTPDGTVTEVGTVPDVEPDGEGGLLGLAISPTYETDQLVYVYYTAPGDNRIARMTYDGTTLGEPEVILTGIDKASIHNGGRIEFGPDGMLYAGTGDAANSDHSQDPESLNGKILRMTPDGGVPGDNPTAGSLVYSMGHRNVQGLTWDPDGRLWASELGQNTWDELNLIEPGANYGWPICEGACGDPAYVDPKATWTPAEASPSGLAYAQNTLWMASLRGQRMWAVPIAGGEVDGDPVDFFVNEYGRIRAIEPAPDGSLWVATNTDGQVLRVELTPV